MPAGQILHATWATGELHLDFPLVPQGYLCVSLYVGDTFRMEHCIQKSAVFVDIWVAQNRGNS